MYLPGVKLWFVHHCVCHHEAYFSAHFLTYHSWWNTCKRINHCKASTKCHATKHIQAAYCLHVVSIFQADPSMGSMVQVLLAWPERRISHWALLGHGIQIRGRNFVGQTSPREIQALACRALVFSETFFYLSGGQRLIYHPGNPCS